MIIVKEGIVAELSLNTFNQIASVLSDNSRIFRIAFIGAPPAVVAHNRNGGRKGPVQTSHQYFFCSNSTNFMHQVGVIGRTQTNVMGEKCRTNNIVMAVNSICSPQRGDSGSAIGFICRCQPKFIRQRDPGGGRGSIVTSRRRITAIEYRPQMIVTYLIWCHRANISLNNLTNLFFQTHLSDQCGNALLFTFIALNR